MCLTEDFFFYSMNESKKYKKQGYNILQDVLEELSITEEFLFKLNWIQEKKHLVNSRLT